MPISFGLSATARRRKGVTGHRATSRAGTSKASNRVQSKSPECHEDMKDSRTSDLKPPFQIRIFGTSRTSRIKDFALASHPEGVADHPKCLDWFAIMRCAGNRGSMATWISRCLEHQKYILSIFVMQIHKEKKKKQVNTDHHDGMFHPFFCSAHRIADVYR